MWHFSTCNKGGDGRTTAKFFNSTMKTRQQSREGEIKGLRSELNPAAAFTPWPGDVVTRPTLTHSSISLCQEYVGRACRLNCSCTLESRVYSTTSLWVKAPLKDLEQMSEGGGAAEVYKHRWAGLVCRMTQWPALTPVLVHFVKVKCFQADE